MTQYYTASKSRSQGRESFSLIFRHPARLDDDGRPGRRVRKGIGTIDEMEADRLVDELNVLLRTESFWEPASRARAADRFDPRVVDAFYGSIDAASASDPKGVRNELLPLPSAEDGYQSVMLLGTTGAGKTTVVRQLLGTDPDTERFPSTSTAKTTVADTEIVIAKDGPFRAAVTFFPREEVVDYLRENVADAGLAVFKERPDREVVRRLLDHVNQRFRFSYVLGRPRLPGADADDDFADDEDDLLDDEGDDVELLDGVPLPSVDSAVTDDVVLSALALLKQVVPSIAATMRTEWAPENAEDDQFVEDYIEENLDAELRAKPEFHQIVDSLIEEIEKRFALLAVGDVRKTRQGWPISWSWSSEDRSSFIKVVSRFSSNYAKWFGTLLTPLVNGIRVAGPFAPTWSADFSPLVLIDGEGLGHTPSSAAALSTHVVRRMEEVDHILLVDSAKHPMQAAPVAALKGVAVSGLAPKLVYLFTHFDQVGGPNLPTFSAREEHVLASAENALRAIGDEIGPANERALRKRLDGACFFVGGIQEPLDEGRRTAQRTIDQLRVLVANLMAGAEGVDLGPSVPVYDRMNLSLALEAATKTFHAKWRALLGLPGQTTPATTKAHWATVKALTRRFAEGWDLEYGDLKPVADLAYQLQRQVSLMLQRPVRWEGGEPSSEEQDDWVQQASYALTGRLSELTRRRLADEVRVAWQHAYDQRGQGSTSVRARIIAGEVYDRAAPVPAVAASPGQNAFMRQVADTVASVAEELGLILE
ncbi:MAG: hypothetical protein AB7H92_03680 [Microbacteriaceae bacterium]